MNEQLRIIAPPLGLGIDQLFAPRADQRSFKCRQRGLGCGWCQLDEAAPQDIVEPDWVAERATGAKQALGEPNCRWLVV